MKLSAAILGLCFALAASCFAQTHSPASPPAASAPQSISADPIPDEQQAKQALVQAADQIQALPPSVAAYLSLEVATGLAKFDPKKERAALEAGFQATLQPTAEKQEEFDLQMRQEQVLSMLMKDFGQDSLRNLLPLAKPATRASITGKIAFDDLDRGKTDDAVNLLESLGAGPDFPIGVACDVMEHLPPARNGDVLALFNAALASWQGAKNAEFIPLSDDDIGNMIIRFQHRLPPNLVLQAIDDMLKRTADSERDHAMSLSFGGTKTGLDFKSMYEFRLFEFLPILQRLDRVHAEDLLEKNAEVKTLLQKMPDGMQSFDPNLSDQPPAKDAQPPYGTVMFANAGDMGPQAQYLVAEESTEQKVLKTAETDPQAAIEAAKGLQPDTHALILAEIAEKHWKQDSKGADAALAALSKVIPTLAFDDEQSAFASRGSWVYLQLHENDAAAAMIAQGMSAAQRLYKADSDSDDPNLAPEVMWPSTRAYQYMMLRSAKLDPQHPWAAYTPVLDQIPDPTIQLALRIELADHILGSEVKEVATEVRKKDRTGESYLWRGYGPAE